MRSAGSYYRDRRGLEGMLMDRAVAQLAVMSGSPCSGDGGDSSWRGSVGCGSSGGFYHGGGNGGHRAHADGTGGASGGFNQAGAGEAIGQAILVEPSVMLMGGAGRDAPPVVAIGGT